MSVAQIFDQTIPYVSGYSMRSRYITDSLAQLGMDIKVFSSPIFSYKSNGEKLGGVSYIRSEIPRWGWVRKFPIIREGSIVRTIRGKMDSCWSKDIKVIDAHSSVLNGLAGLQLAKKRKVPFVYEVRALWEDAAVDQGKTKEGSLRYNLTRKIETHVIERADKVTVICEGLKKDIVSRGVPAHKVEVIPNGVDAQIFKPQEKDRELIDRYMLKGCHVFGFIGTFFHFEGLELFMKAIKQVLIKRKDVKFMFVGGGEQENGLKRLVTELGLNRHVIFTGRVKHNDIGRYYSVMDVMVYPRISKRITELVTPLKPLEAMAFEKIVLASDVGGMRELIKDGDNGLLFKAEDVSDLAHKCLYILDHPHEFKGMGKRARAYVLKERDWLKICEKYLSIFKELGVII